jgi:hypothetical protein
VVSVLGSLLRLAIAVKRVERSTDAGRNVTSLGTGNAASPGLCSLSHR